MVQATRKKRVSLAKQHHKYDLYQQSVQEPDADVKFFKRVFRKQFGRRPHILREDFCGTAWISCTWVADHSKNESYGYDIDPEPIEWGMKHNTTKLNDEQLSRLHVQEGNALDVSEPKADIIAGLNFSYFCFKTRDQLREYFQAAYDNLPDEGLFVLDIMGGPDCITEQDEDREVEDFFYIWDQERVDPINNGLVASISFEFKDGSKIRNAFRYDWRLWSPPEVREVLAEVGFKESAVYWEGTDKDSEEGNGIFTRKDVGDFCDSWIAYLVGFKY